MPRRAPPLRAFSRFSLDRTGFPEGERRAAEPRGRHPHDAARCAARASPPHRHQEGLRPRPVRRLHGDRRRAAHQFVPDARGHARGRRASRPSKGSARPSTCIRCRPRSSSTTATSAATARPGQICSAVAVLDEIKAGIPSHVTGDLTAEPQLTERRNARAHERQHLPLRRLFQHRRSDHRSRREARHESLHLRARRSRPPKPRRPRPRIPDAKFIAGGTNLLDLMKLQIETPTHLIDVNGLALDKIEPTPDGGLRIGALVRNTDLAADERVRRDYGVLSRALLAGASGPAAQQGDDRRQSAAADALPVFLRHQPAVQQAPARQRLRRDRRRQPAARGDRRRATPASRRIRATWRSRCARSTRRSRPCSPDGTTRSDSDRGLPSPARRHAAYRDGARRRAN